MIPVQEYGLDECGYELNAKENLYKYLRLWFSSDVENLKKKTRKQRQCC